MNKQQNVRINLTDLLEYLKEYYSNLPTHVFEVLGEAIDDLNQEKSMSKLDYQSEYIFENKDVDISLPDSKLSDIDSLEYFFRKYLFSVENGKPNQNNATRLKSWVDIIQAKTKQ